MGPPGLLANMKARLCKALPAALTAPEVRTGLAQHGVDLLDPDCASSAA
jgi:hypothetical protein